MNTKTTSPLSSRFKKPAQRQLLAWGVIVCVAMLSFFVHTVSEGVDRGEQFRASLATGMPLAVAAQGR